MKQLIALSALALAAPSYLRPSVCAGGFGRNVGGRICF